MQVCAKLGCVVDSPPLLERSLVGQPVAGGGVVGLVQRLGDPEVGGLVELVPGAVDEVLAGARADSVVWIVDADELEGPLRLEGAAAGAVVGEEANLGKRCKQH